MPDSMTPNIISPVLPVYLGPKGNRPEVINDQHCVFLVDADNNFLGFDSNWGRGGPLGELLYAQRSTTRDL